MELNKELSIFLDKILQINDIFSKKLIDKHDNIAARFATDETYFFININKKNIYLELADMDRTSSSVPENRMKVYKNNENSFVSEATNFVIPSTKLYFDEANKLSEFITVEEYEEILRELVSFANKSLGVADFKTSPQINKIDSVFDLELEKVINSFSWYEGYDLKSYLDLLLKRAWELTYIKQAKERELYPDFQFLPIYFPLIPMILFSPYYEKTDTILDCIIPNFHLYGAALILLLGIYTFLKNRFIRKTLQLSSEQKFNIKSTLDFIRLNKTTLGEFNVLFFLNSIIYDMREWVLDRRFISDNWDDNERNNYLTLYKYYFKDK